MRHLSTRPGPSRSALRSAELYRGIAALYATAARQDASRVRPAIEYVARAVQLGCKPEAFASDTRYSALHKQPAFRDALRSPFWQQARPRQSS